MKPVFADTSFLNVRHSGKAWIHAITGWAYYGVALLVLIAGISKIWAPGSLVHTLDQLLFLTGAGVSVLATLIPLSELIIGSLLLLKIKGKHTLFVSFVLFFSFWLFSIYGSVMGLKGDCGCFANLVRSHFGWPMIVRNTLLMSLSFLLFYIYPKQENPEP